MKRRLLSLGLQLAILIVIGYVLLLGFPNTGILGIALIMFIGVPLVLINIVFMLFAARKK